MAIAAQPQPNPTLQTKSGLTEQGRSSGRGGGVARQICKILGMPSRVNDGHHTSTTFNIINIT